MTGGLVTSLTVEPVPRRVPPGAVLEVAALAATAALVCVVATDGTVLLANPALCRATGWSSDEVVGRLFWDVLVVAEDKVLAEDHVARAVLTGETPSQEGDWLDRWGGRRRVAVTTGVLRDRAGQAYAVVLLGLDVTSWRLAEADLRTRATTDALTGLPNRDSLLRALERVLLGDGAARCGVLFADLDGFKAANDTHGHQVGDLLLRAVADRLVAALPAEAAVYRYGGDEFVVLCEGTDAGGVREVRLLMEAAVTEPFVTPHGLVDLGLSVGSALGRPGDLAADLVAAADRHMYGVKTTHRSRRRSDDGRRPAPA